MNVHISQMVTCAHVCLARDEKWTPVVYHAVIGHIQTCTTLSAAFDPLTMSMVPKQNFDFKLQNEAIIVPVTHFSGGARLQIHSFKNYIYTEKMTPIERSWAQTVFYGPRWQSRFNILVSLSNDGCSLLYIDRMNPRSPREPERYTFSLRDTFFMHVPFTHGDPENICQLHQHGGPILKIGS